MAIILFFLFVTSVFKNISYPLFWADESMTAIGSERVLEFGYPKVHDGKNVFYDLRHSNPKLGINEESDAYVGGTGWGHYYFGIIGYKLAELTDDIYAKTGLYRATYAVAGLFGLLLIGFLISRCFADKFSKYAFISLFLLFELMSISLALLLREVRYYSLVLLLSCLIIGLYSSYRFCRPFDIKVIVCIESISLWLLFITFFPVYFICILSIGLSELVIAAYEYSKSDLVTAAKKAFPVALFLAISFIGVYPLFSYFKTFEISGAMNEFNGYNRGMYWNNVSTIFNYFKCFELLLLAAAMKIFLIFDASKLFAQHSPIFKVSNFLTLFVIVYVFAIAKIPNFIFTRYIIYLQPFLSIIIILDLFIILHLYSTHSTRLINAKMLLPITVLAGLFIYIFSTNLQNVKGHFYEMSHIYKGPLDFTIPFVKEMFPKTDTLVIAANYEETSYMYYLKCKVIVGYTGNNLAEDSTVNPRIIAYRKFWGNHVSIFLGYMQKGTFENKSFAVYDNPFNNIPELNVMPAFNHQFETLPPSSRDNAVCLYIRK